MSMPWKAGWCPSVYNYFFWINPMMLWFLTPGYGSNAEEDWCWMDLRSKFYRLML